MTSEIRPLGGLLALSLSVASLGEVALSKIDSGCSIPILEDRSTYGELIEWCGDVASVTHSLSVVTPLHYTLPDDLEAGLSGGFVAHLMMQSRQEIVVGWSQEALFDRALRLVSCTTISGEKPADRGYKTWIFESIDGVSAI